MTNDLSQWTVSELRALVEQGLPLADYEAEMRRRGLLP
jgi:hypothetical protein